MTDIEKIKEIVANIYYSIKVNTQKLHDWKLFQSLFIKEAILIENNDKKIKVLSVNQYIKEMKEAFNQYKDLSVNGFEEYEIEANININMNNAYYISKYKKKYKINECSYEQDGENYIQLIRNSDSWKIISIMWNE